MVCPHSPYIGPALTRGFISDFGPPTVRNVRKTSNSSYIPSKSPTFSIDIGLNFGSTMNNQITVVSAEVLYLVVLYIVGSLGLFSDAAIRKLLLSLSSQLSPTDSTWCSNKRTVPWKSYLCSSFPSSYGVYVCWYPHG